MKKNESKIEPKILKGTRDFTPVEMAKRNLVMAKIRKVFEKFGYDAIETPIICPAETILGKYGDEGNRLTYNFDDAGGRRIALPFDLTVPFARFFAANWRELTLPFKRYQIQRVWRAEKPQKGRLREFYQCDIDIIGTRNLTAESEIAAVVVEVFKELGLEFRIKINSRRLMNTVLERFNIPEEKRIGVITIIDKILKIGEEAVIAEIKALGVENPKEILELLKPEKNTKTTLEKFKEYDLKEIEEFFENCENLGISAEYLEFDPSLARGLDYYTGIIYEVVSKDSDFGTICAGGRYDNLCGLFCKEDFSGLGVAFGFERIMLLLEKTGAFKDIQLNSKVLVTIFDEESKKDSLKIYADLIKAGINSEIYFEPEKLGKQMKYADKKRIPFVVIRGSEEIEKEEVTIKFMNSGKQKTIPRTQLTSYLSNYYESKE
ncbi:histidine--tRNA ligase [Candidatus Peregrinibacteria bacterium]|jgi:histidyl-tRNA synthetase|nr:histidine--tRNA ligase [Candidatus Peregrinibacteria bacterium]MBT4056037.1 histidine--tRNA ligase [Candidatus Peregrinibacteria bacterium]